MTKPTHSYFLQIQFSYHFRNFKNKQKKNENPMKNNKQLFHIR